MKYEFRAHPWHGVDLWPLSDKSVVNVFFEIVPEDRIKYEIDKKSGILKVYDSKEAFKLLKPVNWIMQY